MCGSYHSSIAAFKLIAISFNSPICVCGSIRNWTIACRNTRTSSETFERTQSWHPTTRLHFNSSDTDHPALCSSTHLVSITDTRFFRSSCFAHISLWVKSLSFSKLSSRFVVSPSIFKKITLLHWGQPLMQQAHLE